MRMKSATTLHKRVLGISSSPLTLDFWETPLTLSSPCLRGLWIMPLHIMTSLQPCLSSDSSVLTWQPTSPKSGWRHPISTICLFSFLCESQTQNPAIFRLINLLTPYRPSSGMWERPSNLINIQLEATATSLGINRESAMQRLPKIWRGWWPRGSTSLSSNSRGWTPPPQWGRKRSGSEVS